MSTHPQTGSLYFIRHAPVVKRPGHVPPADPPITSGPFNLAPLREQLPEDAIWHVSPLQRTVQTAELLKNHLKPARVSPTADLVEMDHGSWHDMPVSQVWDEIKDGPLHNWTFLPADTVPPQGESFGMLAGRVRDWMKKIEAGFDTTPRIIVTHAGVMRAALSVALHAPLDHVVGIPVPHFGILRLTLMDPARSDARGGCWLFEELSNPVVVSA